MAFISMVFASAVLIVLIIGFIALALGIIFDVIWFIRSKSKKNTHILLKIPAVLFSLAGMLLFILPVFSALTLGAIGKSQELSHFLKTENKTYVEGYDWRDEGFEYKGMKLVKADFLSFSKKDSKVEDGVIVVSDEKKYYISYLPNDGEFDIYDIDKISGIYCDEEQYEEIYEYYHDTKHLNTTIEELGTENKNVISKDFDADIIFELRKLYDKDKEDRISGKSDDIDGEYYIKAKSEDGLFYESVSVYDIDGHYYLCSSLSTTGFKAYEIPENLEKRIRDILE